VAVFARIVVGVDGTEWGFEALRQALLLAPAETSTVGAITALDTGPAIHTGSTRPASPSSWSRRRPKRVPLQKRSSTAVPARPPT
jgi:nucleotide-binding universal stress UspA family protein